MTLPEEPPEVASAASTASASAGGAGETGAGTLPRLPPEVGALVFGHLAAAQRHALPALPLLQLLQHDDRVADKHRHLVVALAGRATAEGSVGAAMRALPRLFSAPTAGLVEAAAADPQGPALLDALAADYALVARWKQSLVAVLRWPLTLAALLSLTLLVVTIWVLPSFQSVFESFGADLPLPTVVVLELSRWVSRFGLALLLAAAIGVWAWRSGRFPPRWANALASGMSRLPLLGPVLRHLRVARLVGWLQRTQHRPGMLAQALAHLQATSARAGPERAALHTLRERLAAGLPLSQALQGLPGYPPALAQTLRLGEDAGNATAAVALLAEQNSGDVDEVLQRFEHRLTLGLYLTLGTAVGVTVIAMYLPIFKLGAVV
jgi:type IV pilus assembly protein PilC